MNNDHLHKKFIKFLLDRYNPKRSKGSEDPFEKKPVEPDQVINELLSEYEKVKKEYEDLLRR